MKKIHLFKNLSSHKNCIHLVTQKDPTEPYSFSLALHTQENPKAILSNRSHLKEQYPHMHFIVANQTHSDNIHIIRENQERGWREADDAIENCDALLTDQTNVMLTILTADCVPILLFDPIKHLIGAIHAGWKGTKEQIVLKTIKKMQNEFNSNPKEIMAAIAPSIGSCCYEVEWDVAQYFEHIQRAYTQKEEKYMLDLPHINKLQLLHAGLSIEHIEMSNICTACRVEDYFSYRKEGGCSGRFISMIGLN